ncbi:hypothetical protein ACNKH9_01040 [Metapseudomonas otitidis]|uniref:hypothetical protein n=1 Tax=Metapseudomonas otitidis TaxID=319939 RepID=UPI003A8AE221
MALFLNDTKSNIKHKNMYRVMVVYRFAMAGSNAWASHASYFLGLEHGVTLWGEGCGRWVGGGGGVLIQILYRILRYGMLRRFVGEKAA